VPGPVKEHHAELALAVQADLGEGPVWDERSQQLYFVDIMSQRAHIFTPATGAHSSFDVGRVVGAVVLREDGGLVLAAHDGFFLAEADGGGLSRFGEFRSDGATVRFNDGKVGPDGRFYAGTMDWGESQVLGCLYVLGHDGQVSVLVEEVGISNGLAWSADGKTMYYIDTPRHSVDAFSFDPELGTISDRRVVAEVANGSPDGMAIDVEGCLWVACWGGSRVERIDPADGKRLAVVQVPTSHVSSVAFGGAKLDDLYITTARHSMDEQQLAKEPHAGDLFVTRPGVAGPASNRFAGARAVGTPAGG
jgi:sugar lactone lactonase YvrE